MICPDCMKAADTGNMALHCSTEGCTCHHWAPRPEQQQNEVKESK